jgi:transposase
MSSSPFLPLPPGLEILATESIDDLLRVEVVSTRSGSRCPLCFHPAMRIHSRYTRVVADVPCGGFQVQLVLQVRKFFCDTPQCPRKIFTERLPVFVQPWARMTTRFSQMLQALALATCGELGARLAGRLGMHTSPTTLLRRVMALPTAPPEHVSSLGIDDFSFRRGRTFGTILVDLDRHQVIDLLADRSTKSAAAWMRQHPEIKYVSRDRGNNYAQAAREGAPQATPVADRFHLTKNLVEAIEPLVARCYKELRKAQAPLPLPAVPKANEWRQTCDKNAQHQRLARLANNQERFAQMIAFQQRGIPQKEIASRLGITVRTVQHWNERGACPGSQRRRKRSSIFDPYAPYVLARWKQGCRDISLLWQEIQAQGFPGKIRTVYRFIRTLRQEPVELPAPSVLDRVSVQEALWLIARPLDDLKADERIDLQELCQASSKLSTLHTLVQSFGQIVRKREGYRLQDWKKQVAESGLSEVQRFAKGLKRDEVAVLAGLTVVYSNGQVEGQVNKLKLLKRTMYGRAEFPLLRQRVLHAL